MELHVPDYVKVKIGGTWVTEYVISYERDSNLCELGDTFSVELSPDAPIPDPYDTIYIEERYATTANVLDGYIIKVSRDFDPGSIKISGMDKSILLTEYFISEQIYSAGQSVDYWISYLCGLVGLSVQFDAYASNVIVEEDTPLGFQSLADVILGLERKAAYYLKYDSSINMMRVFRYESSEPVITIGEDKTLEAARSMGTDNTRNVVKIYGGYNFDVLTGIASPIFATARTEMDELVTDKTAVIASPALRSFTSAYMVASRILSVVNSIDDDQSITTDGFYPSIQVGETAHIKINQGPYEFEGDRRITSIHAEVGAKGATTTFSVGAKCPRVSVQLPIPPIYATSDVDGVAVSWDGGDSFVVSNAGLDTPEALSAWSIGVNQWGQSMVLTVAGIYKRYGTGGLWLPVGQLPDPVNTSLDSVPTTVSGIILSKVVDEPTKYGTFHVLANISGFMSLQRSWIYTTRNFGATWDSSQLYVQMVPSGIIWNVTGIDIEASPVNNMYVLVAGYEPTLAGIYFLTQGAQDSNFNSREIYVWDTTGVPTVVGDITYAKKSVNGEPDIFSLPAGRNRAIAIAIRGTATTKPFVTLEATSNGGATWATIYDQQIAETPEYPGNVGYTETLYTSFYAIFDYYSISSSFELHIPGVIVASNIDPQGGYYRTTQKFYTTGWDISVDNMNNVSIGQMAYVLYAEKTWTHSFAFGGGTYFIQNATDYGSRKWQSSTRISVGWLPPTGGDVYPPGNTYSDQGAFVITNDVYTSNPAETAFDTSLTWSLPAGRHPSTKSALQYLHAYHDGYFYLVDQDALSPTYMYVDRGAGTGLSEYLTEQAYINVLDIDTREVE